MGPAGAGKTTVGRRLASALDWQFLEADDFHSPAGVEKMRRGEPLTETDRAPWLDRLVAAMLKVDSEARSAVLAASALRRAHRERLREGADDVRFIHLRAHPELLRSRLESRPDHFAGAELLASQLATLEPPDRALILDAVRPPDDLVREAFAWLER